VRTQSNKKFIKIAIYFSDTFFYLCEYYTSYIDHIIQLINLAGTYPHSLGDRGRNQFLFPPDATFLKSNFLVYDCLYIYTHLSLFTTSMPHDKIFNHQMCPVDCVNHVIDLSKYVLAMFFCTVHT
jgi:hypothetical protein